MNCGVRNTIISSQNELQEIINEISLFFNNNNNIILTDQFKNIILNQIQQGEIRKSRNNYLAEYGFDQNPDIITLLDIPHKIVSSSYGCIHDFHDNETAINCWNQNLSTIYPNLLNSGLNQKTLQIIENYHNGLNYKTTHKLTDIWLSNQIETDTIINNHVPNYSFPVINHTIFRYDENDSDSGNDKDILSIKLFLEKYNIEPGRIIWVVDTFRSWLTNISPNKLNMKDTIAEIDGASSSVEGNYNTLNMIGYVNEIHIGPLTFNVYMNSNNKLQIGIYNRITNTQLANANTNASVQKIINTITTLFPNIDLSKANRSNTVDTYNIDFLVNSSDKDKLLILEYIKAAGDQAPIDIAEKIVKTTDNPENNYNNNIFWFTTGDELAFELAKSRGLASLYISPKIIKISIPTSMTNPDVRIPTLVNFFSKFEKMKLFFNVFNVNDIKLRNSLNEIIEYINNLSNYSIAGKIFASKIIEKFKEYFNKCNINIEKIIQAIHLLSNSFTTKNYLDFYKFIEKNLNNVDFSIDSVYDYLFTSDEYNYIFSLDVTRQVNKIDILKEDIITEPNTKKPIVSFCDNYTIYGEVATTDKTLDCTKEHDITLLKENAFDYLKNVCSTDINMNNCMGERYKLLKNKIPKNIGVDIEEHIKKTDIILEGTLDEKWLLVGETRYFTKGNWKAIVKNPYIVITIDILRTLVNNRSIIEILNDIPMEIFNVEFDKKLAEQGLIKEAMERIIYIFKVLHLSLENLEVDNLYLNNNIECIFVDFLLCPPVELKEAEQNSLFQSQSQPIQNFNLIPKFQSQSTPIILKDRRTKTEVNEEYTRKFLKNIYMVYNIPLIINDVINTTDIGNFKFKQEYDIINENDKNNSILYLDDLISNLKNVQINNTIQNDYQYLSNYKNILINYEKQYKSFIDSQSLFYNIETNNLIETYKSSINSTSDFFKLGGKKTKQNNKTKTNKNKNRKTKTKKQLKSNKMKKSKKSNKTNKKR
jgi:hypothetical protein